MSKAKKSKRPSGVRRLAYTLIPWASSPTGLGVVAWRVQERDGGYGPRRVRANPVKPSAEVRDERLIDAGFARLWDAHEARDPVHNGIALPAGMLGGELFDILLDSGRLHWEDLDVPPMARASARTGKAVWRTDIDAVERPAIGLESEHPDDEALGLTCLRWIDVPRRIAGPIDCALTEDQLAEFLRQAPLQPGQRLGQRLRDALAASGFPIPRARSLRVEGRIRPSPILVARRRAEPTGAEVQIDARVLFDYDGVEIDSSTRGHTARVVHDDEVVERSRWLVLERQMIEEPVAAGFSVASGGVLAWLGTEADWHSMLDSGLEGLERRRWTIRIESEERPEEIDRWYARVTPAPTSEFERERERAESAPERQPRPSRSDTPARRWFVSLGVEIDGERIDVWPAVLEAIATARRREGAGGDELNVREDLVVQVEERFIRIPASRLQAIVDLVRGMGDAPIDPTEPLRGDTSSLAALDVDEWEGESQAAGFFARLQRLQPIERVDPPDSLETELRDYQRDGLTWLQFLGRNGLGGVLADDMGLGKTVQVLAHLLVEAAAGRLQSPTLVVAPTSVVQGWMREAARFAPQLRTLLLHGPKREEAYDRLGDVDLAVTTYGVLLRDAERLEAFGRAFHLVVLDEAQAIKNPTTKVAAAARGLRAERHLCLTGTPIENNLQELWSLFAFAEPGLFGSRREFARVYRTPIEQRNDASRLGALRTRVRPFMLRRTKGEVLDQLPPKTEILRHCDLAGDQRDLYESVRISMSREVREALRSRGIERSQMVILEALLKLRQVCCDPRLVKADAARNVKGSAKLEQLMQLLGGLLPAGRRVLLFSQFTSMLSLIATELDEAKIPWLELTGSTRNRQAVVDRFQAGEAPVFLISLKAGGTGLNLTAADTVIHYDPWWNPAVEDQATDRAHRIGQDKPVTAYRLVARGTVEETMLSMQRSKRALADGIHDIRGPVRASGLRFDERDLEALLEPIE